MAHALCAFAFAVPFSLVAGAQGGGGGKAKPALKLLRSPRRFLERILGG